MKPERKERISKWFDYFQRCGSVEIAFRRAETWNEGMTGKRFKTNPVDFVTLSVRANGLTISGEPEVAKEAYLMMAMAGLIGRKTGSRTMKARPKWPNGRLSIYVETKEA